MLELNKIYNMDCLDGMKQLDTNSVDAIVTDPPYGLEFMGKEWDKFKKGNVITAPQGAFEHKKGFKQMVRMPKDIETLNAFQQFTLQWAKEALRILKPGAFLLSFGGTRTYHRMACAIEDAGFEIRDQIQWLYGSGFPKSMDIGQDFDRQECRKRLTKKLGRKPTKDEFKEEWKNFRKVIGKQNYTSPKADNSVQASSYGISGGLGDYAGERIQQNITQPVTEEAKQWEGWGTALKPACEPIVVARKPLSEKNVALNVLKWGTGGINIDGCRIPYKSETDKESARFGTQADIRNNNYMTPKGVYGKDILASSTGRFPSNIILDEESAKILDKQSGELKSGDNCTRTKEGFFGEHGGLGKAGDLQITYGDKGGASRFFYVAKASKGERNDGCENFDIPEYRWNNCGEMKQIVDQKGNFHPTVKPITLMQYLIKLVTPKDGTVLDPFIGSGTTFIASWKENKKCIGFEKDKEYWEIAQARIKDYLVQKKLFEVC